MPPARASGARQGAAGATALASVHRHAQSCSQESARRAIAKGVRQILVLGAGLDTFAYRLEPTPSLRVFELDHPATQAEKRQRLARARTPEPAHVAYVAHDFEDGSMAPALKGAGFDTDTRTFIVWLGVTPYLTEEAVFATLSELAQLPRGAGSRLRLRQPARSGHGRCDPRSSSANGRAGRGERRAVPVLSQLRRAARSRKLGFSEIVDLDRAALIARYLPDLPVRPRPGPGGHVVRMATA